MLLEETLRPKVKVFSAGDHYHADPEEAAELIEHVLVRCGYTKPIAWECRIDKMRHCSAESRVLRVISWKPFGVILRVKPTPNATVDQQMTLLIPPGSGYSASNLYNQLKGVEKSVSRAWRQEQRKIEMNKSKTEQFTIKLPWLVREEPKELPVVNSQSIPSVTPKPAIIPSASSAPIFTNLKGIVNNPDKLRFVLEKIYVLESENIRSKSVFIKRLMELCNWKDFLPRTCGRVINEFVKYEYIMERTNDKGKTIGFSLATKGAQLIGKETTVPSSRLPTPSDFVSILLNSHEKIQELADVGSKLAANVIKRYELKQQLSLLDEEDKELLNVIKQNKEAYDILSQLNNIVVPLPEKN